MLLALLGTASSCSLLFDTPSEAGVCEETIGLFDTINILGNVDDPSVSLDGMTLFFNLRVDGLESLWRATRDEPCAPWSIPEKLELASAGTVHDDIDDPTLGTLGNCLYYEFNDVGWSASAQPGEPEELMLAAGLKAALGIETGEGCATRYLVDRDDAIYVAELGQEPTILNLGSGKAEESPWLAPDLSSILFVSKEVAGSDQISSEVHIAQATGDLSFGPAERISELGDIVSDPWVSSGLIYAVRGKPPNRRIFVLGTLP